MPSAAVNRQRAMKCEFCAEEIQDAAVVCRFCGAAKLDGRWRMPGAARPARAPAGTFTLRFAGAAFGLSAVMEPMSIGSPVPVLGALRGGAVAALYHGVYVAMFAALFVGLWRTRRWAYPLLVASTVFYTLDNLRYVLDRSGMKAQLDQQIGALGGMRDMIDEGSLLRTMTVTALLFAACWWGFVLFVRRRRDLLAA